MAVLHATSAAGSCLASRSPAFIRAPTTPVSPAAHLQNLCKVKAVDGLPCAGHRHAQTDLSPLLPAAHSLASLLRIKAVLRLQSTDRRILMLTLMISMKSSWLCISASAVPWAAPTM